VIGLEAADKVLPSGRIALKDRSPSKLEAHTGTISAPDADHTECLFEVSALSGATPAQV